MIFQNCLKFHSPNGSWNCVRSRLKKKIDSWLRITILKYNSWYLCQISLQILLLPILIYNFICKITKLPWQRAVRVSSKMAAKFLNVLTGLLYEDVRALKKALEIRNTKSTSRRILIPANFHDSAVSLTIFYLPSRVSQSQGLISFWNEMLRCWIKTDIAGEF